MITSSDLQSLSKERLEDAQILFKAGRMNWAIYTCGYAVELALKKKICDTLGWKGFPVTRSEFKDLSSFKTHDLDMLLHLSGIENWIKKEKIFADWSIIASWSPEMRYSSKKQTEEDAKLLLEPVVALLRKL